MHGWTGKSSDPAQELFDLTFLEGELVLVLDVLVAASAAAAKVGTFRRDSLRGSLSDLHKLRFGKPLLVPYGASNDVFAINCERNKKSLAVGATYAFAAEGDVFDEEF